MDERVMQFRVGVMVLATLLITGILVILFGKLPTMGQSTYTIHFYFEEAPGVHIDTPVTKSGQLIGRVTQITFDDEDGGVWVTAGIEGNRKLFQRDKPRISGSLLGDATIEFVLDRSQMSNRTLIPSEAKLRGEVVPSPVQAITALQNRMTEVFDAVPKITKTVEETGESMRAASDAIRETAGSFTETSEKVQEVVATFRTMGPTIEGTAKQIAEATRSFHDTSKAVQETAKSITATSDSFKLTSEVVRETGLEIKNSAKNFDQTNKQIQEIAAKVPEALASFKTTSQSLVQASEEWKQVGKNVNLLFQGEQGQVPRLLNKAEKTLDHIDGGFEELRKASIEIRQLAAQGKDFLGDPELRANLKKSLEKLPAALEDFRVAMNGVPETFDAIKRAVDSANRNLTNLEGITEPLGQEGEMIVARFSRVTQRIDLAMEQIAEITAGLNRGQGTIGQLLRNPELYQTVLATANNVEQISLSLEPIIRDARIFADKIARHPELLGVRGAISQSQGAKQ